MTGPNPAGGAQIRGRRERVLSESVRRDPAYAVILPAFNEEGKVAALLMRPFPRKTGSGSDPQ